MRKVSTLSVFILFFICCKKQVEMPIVLTKSDTLFYQSINLKFKTNETRWDAYLTTFTQPIKLHTSFENNVLRVYYKSKNGIIEAPTKVCLVNRNKIFTYNYFLKNSDNVKIISKDYRSSKTVNPDSSLHHDKISYKIDKWQNLISINNLIFNQQQINHKPKVATYNAIPQKNISAYYIVPGSCTSIELNYEKDAVRGFFVVSTTQLFDKYQNIIANGTKVKFELFNNKEVFKAYSATENGVAKIRLPIQMYKGFEAKATIHLVNSPSILLN